MNIPNNEKELVYWCMGLCSALEVMAGAIARVLPASEAIANTVEVIERENAITSPIDPSTLPPPYQSAYRNALDKFLASARS